MDDDPDRTPPPPPRLELVPPRRPPPTAVGAGTPDRRGRRPNRAAVPEFERGVLRFVEDAAVEYVGLLRAGLARLFPPRTRER